MNAKILLYNSREETFSVEIEYEIEDVSQGWYLPSDIEVTRCVIRTDLNGFVSSDLKADIEAGIGRIVCDFVDLKCRVEYASDKKWSRIARINPECKLLDVA